MKKSILFLAMILVTSTIFSQVKRKIIDDYNSLKITLKEIKGQMEWYGADMKEKWIVKQKKDPKDSTKMVKEFLWQVKDSLMLISINQYVAVQSAQNAVVDAFADIIVTPKLLTEGTKKNIATKLDSLKKRQEQFIKHYNGGTLILARGPGFTNLDVAPVVAVIEAGFKLYKAIRDMVKGERTKTAEDFKTSCKMEPWHKVTNTETAEAGEK